MFSWLSGLSVLTSGALPVQYACENAEVTAANAPAQGWLTTSDDEAGIPATQFFSYDTTTLPDAGAPLQCGRVVYSDIHVGAASNDYGGNLGAHRDRRSSPPGARRASSRRRRTRSSSCSSTYRGA